MGQKSIDFQNSVFCPLFWESIDWIFPMDWLDIPHDIHGKNPLPGFSPSSNPIHGPRREGTKYCLKRSPRFSSSSGASFTSLFLGYVSDVPMKILMCVPDLFPTNKSVVIIFGCIMFFLLTTGNIINRLGTTPDNLEILGKFCIGGISLQIKTQAVNL